MRAAAGVRVGCSYLIGARSAPAQLYGPGGPRKGERAPSRPRGLPEADWAGLRSRPLISQKMRFCMLHGFLKIEHPKIETHSTTISAASPRFEWYLGLLCESYSTGFHQVKYVFCVPPSGAGWNH